MINKMHILTFYCIFELLQEFVKPHMYLEGEM